MAATLVLKLPISARAGTLLTALSFANRESMSTSTPFPKGDMAPIPVTTTLFINIASVLL